MSKPPPRVWRPNFRRLAWLAIGLLLGAGGSAIGQDPPRGASIQTADGKVWSGKVIGDASAGFRFQADPPGPTLGLDQAGLVRFTPESPTDPAGSPPFRVVLGHDQAVSGRGPSVDDQTVRLEVGPGGRPFAADRSGVLAVRQRPGEAVVLLAGFESWDDAVWEREGELALDESDHREGAHSLLLPTSPAKLSHRLPSPIASGRVDLLFRHDGRIAPGRRWYVELDFQKGDGPSRPVRVVPGWSDESPGVETPDGPSLAIQRLTIADGWHSLVVIFGGDQLEIAIDHDVLAHGKGAAGDLAAVRLASEPKGSDPAPAGLSARVDDLRIVRFLDDSRSQDGDQTLDELRLISGDQLFGAIRKADGRGAAIELMGRLVEYPWTDLTGLSFRRGGPAPRPILGQQVRIAWSAGDERRLDAVEGTLLAVTAQAFEVATPFAGTLSVPTDRVRLLAPLGRGARWLIDPSPHHLGDQFMPRFEPPQPEGGVLERAFTLEKAPESPAFLVVDVIEAAGSADNLDFAPLLQNGELRTNVSINGKQFDYLNRYIFDRNEIVARIHLPVPEGLLKAGENRVRFDQVGKKSDPGYLDDLGIRTIALEVPEVQEERR